MCQLGTQHHAWILNTGPAGDLTKLHVIDNFKSLEMDAILVSYKAHPVNLLVVSCTHRVGVCMCQLGTQHHAWILNTEPVGGVTTVNKYSRAWRWMPSL